MRSTMMSVLGRSILLVVLAVAVVTPACNSQPQRATVKGQVKIGDTPLTVGSVMFWGDNNVTGSATIDKNGNYVMADAPVGNVKVTVSVPKLPPGGMAAMRRMQTNLGNSESESVNPENPGQKISIMGDMPENVVQIPDTYANVETSGLTATIASGEQVHDIQLKP